MKLRYLEFLSVDEGQFLNRIFGYVMHFWGCTAQISLPVLLFPSSIFLCHANTNEPTTSNLARNSRCHGEQVFLSLFCLLFVLLAFFLISSYKVSTGP